ncbi:MAG TPA: HAD hydrolase-like protein [Spirochaetota bacterium]|nr:HAD hydrolase-like protein [Spirochaetota bacterium]HOJ28569.1 HAD hydrolase-like protein [Spirochaetota bacterium]HOM09182.1 HAD hydrolase-like protein [Spirochaetota bacterium]HPP49125.1 HAD hydrolase-like protein [Spirochaetota bacterium]
MIIQTKALLFDFDGTLVDTMEGFADIAGEVIHRFHPEISFEEARRRYLETSGVPFFQQLEIILPGNPTNSQKAAIFEETKKEGFFRSTFSQEVRYVINELRRLGFIVGVSSNNFQYLIEQFINREGLQFDVVLGFRDGFEKGKQHFEYVIQHFNLQKDDLTFVGDSLKDAEKAITNNIKFIGLCGTFTREQFLQKYPNIVTIESLKELLSCVQLY